MTRDLEYKTIINMSAKDLEKLKDILKDVEPGDTLEVCYNNGAGVLQIEVRKDES